MLAAQTAAAPPPMHIAPERTPSPLLTRLRLSRATAVALSLLLDPLCAEPPSAPEGQTLRPVDGPRGQA